jgi:cell division cycle 20-like protein 1 (cofactor of APC complex)
LQDDFYLNLIDWSQQNFLAVGLASNVYLWNGDNSKVTKLCDLGLSDTVTSVGWSPKGPIFSLGTNNGEVHLWDINKVKRIRVMHGHSNRVGSIAWNSSIMSTGSRDKTILNRDIRSSTPFISKLQGHKQEICGLKWSPDEQQLCSGGNDNKLMVWNTKSVNPVLKFSDHIAAVKAVAWSPHQHGLLASGGGTADRNIRFRNTLTGETLRSVDTGSQVCNLIFGKTINELVSTHGYSFNEINIWKYPKMEKVSTLMGHTMRVLYLTMSPDGSTIVTGAGDETLRFWNVFPSTKSRPSIRSQLVPETVLLR